MSVRTSETDPIRVDFLPEGLAGMPGRLGMTIGPGKQGPSALGARWERDLWKDMKRLASEYVYDVDALVTTLEAEEMESLGVGELFDVANDFGVDVYWYPIRDGHTPGGEEDGPDAMRALVDHILTRVYGGETVVVHCRGGLGRSGTVVGCCLRAIEYRAKEALELVREARPGAVENRRQEWFVEDFRSQWTPTNSHFLGNAVWKFLKYREDIGTPEVDDYPSEVVSVREEDEPAVRLFAVEPEDWSSWTVEPVFDPSEAEAVEAFAAQFEGGRRRPSDIDPVEPPELLALDEVIDAAVQGRPIEASPTVAGRALDRLMGRVKPYRQSLTLVSGDLPHLRNAARRLFLSATGVDATAGGWGEVSAGADERAAEEHWATEYGPHLEGLRRRIVEKTEVAFEPRFEPGGWEEPARVLVNVMYTAALRFDGHRYVEHIAPERPGPGSEAMESEGDYERAEPFELAAIFFSIQRGLGGRGSARSPEHSAVRRVFREMFVRLWDLEIPRKWEMRAIDAYDVWRWGLGLVARPFVEQAVEELRNKEWEGPVSLPAGW